MANKFEKKEWTDRESQFPSRRRITETEIDKVFEIERAEGEITEIGNAFDASNMNDFELRVDNAFNNLDDSDIAVIDADNLFTTTRLPGVLKELFMFASNGKTAIANAIRGISSSSTFQQLASAITNGKTAIANAIGQGSANDTFVTLANLITSLKNNYQNTITSLNNTITSLNNMIASLNGTIGSLNNTISDRNNEISSGKAVVATAIGQTSGGIPSSSSSFSDLAFFISSYKKSYFEGVVYMNQSYYAQGTYTQDFSINFGFTPTKIILYGYGGVEDIEARGDNFTQIFNVAFESGGEIINTNHFISGNIENMSATGFRFTLRASTYAAISFGYISSPRLLKCIALR